MNEAIKLTIPAEKFTAIGSMLGESFSDLSPFRLEVEGSDNQPPKEVMHNGKIRADFFPAFKTIANTQAIGACVYLDENSLLDSCFYFPVKEDGEILPVSLTMVDDGILMESPPDLESVFTWLAQHIGLEQVRDCDFEVELKLCEAYTLFGLVDALRKRVFSSMAGNHAVNLTHIPIDEIQAAMSIHEEDDGESLHWLALHFAESHLIEELSTSDLKKNLNDLKKKGLIQIDGEDVIPGDKIDDLASCFLTIAGHLRLQAAHMDEENQLRATEVRGVRGKGNALLLWTEDGKKVQFMGASPAQALAIARDMLSNPDGKRSQPVSNADHVCVDETELEEKKQESKKGIKNGKKGRWWKIALIAIASLAALWVIAFVIEQIMFY